MTVETKGIPLALMTARAFGVPLVVARRDSRVTEGSSVNINYLSGSNRFIQSMSLPKRALPPNAAVIIVDDFMKAGGTARGMMDLAQEVGARVLGLCVLIAAKEPAAKMVGDYTALLSLKRIDEFRKVAEIEVFGENNLC
jgi:purine operon repressor